jgi:hypothetical protein
MGYPEVCNICVRDRVNADLFNGEVALNVRPFEGGRQTVMIAGLNPTTAVRPAVRTVFALDNPDFPIHKYLVTDILRPARLDLFDVYATNLTKCTFPGGREPRRICEAAWGRSDNDAVKDFLWPFFERCRTYFEREIQEVAPKILLAFGEVTHLMICGAYDLASQGVPATMEEAFGHKYAVSLSNLAVIYLPCVRQYVKNHTYFISRFPRFIGQLDEAARSTGITP